jgi:hypothetical protein
MYPPLLRFGSCYLLIAVGTSLCPQLQAGDHALFPWGKRHHSTPIDPTTLPLYHTLTKAPNQDLHHAPPPPVMVQPLSEKRAYAYGWFGSNPSSSWSRHFGYTKGYTQWTQR